MLAFNSDVELTTWTSQLGLFAAFANEGLEMGSSFWFSGDEWLGWTLFDGDDRPSRWFLPAVGLIRAGLLDTVHAFGDRPIGRARVDRLSASAGWKALREEGVSVPIFTNHGSAEDIQNVGASIASYQEGDLPGSAFHHLDLTVSAGCRFFWTDADYDNDDWRFDAVPGSARSLLVPDKGRDGTPIIRFRRFRGHLGPAPTASSLARQLEIPLTGGLAGYTVIYQHLGCLRSDDGKPFANADPYFDGPASERLRELALQQARGDIVVTTTARLLRHAAMMYASPWDIVVEGDEVRLKVRPRIAVGDVGWSTTWEDLEGLTLKLPRPMRTVATLGGETRVLEPAVRHGGPMAWIPWRRLDMGEHIERARAHGLH